MPSHRMGRPRITAHTVLHRMSVWREYPLSGEFDVPQENRVLGSLLSSPRSCQNASNMNSLLNSQRHRQELFDELDI
jgi:hypothetical protein